jgi:hypothetical protein
MNKIIILVAALMLHTINANAQSDISINFSGSSATVDIPADITDVSAYVNGANVAITSTTTTTEYTYRITGSSDDGSLVINGDYKLKIELAGINLTNAHGGAAIDIECGKRIAVELAKGTTNTLKDAMGSQKAAFYFKGHPEFEGEGTLNVTGNAKHAISSKEYMELKTSTGTINILGAVSDGLHCGRGKINNEHNYFLMKGGVVNIANVGSDGIDSDDYGCIRIEDGTLSINVGDESTALKADSIINIRGGNINIAVNGYDSEAIRSRYATHIEDGNINVLITGNGSKGIKGKCYTSGSTVLNGGNVYVSGGNTDIKVLGGDFTDPNGEIKKCMGMSIDADFTQTGGNINIYTFGEEAYTYNIKGTENITSGTITEHVIPWRINTAEYQYDMSAYVEVLDESGTEVTAYSNIAVGAFTGTECIGYAEFISEGYGIMRIYSNSTTTESGITFKMHDRTTGKEYTLTPSESVSFSPSACYGTPDTPLRLTYSTIVPIDKPDGAYYFQNVGSGKFLTAGNYWGTKASLSDNGLDIILTLLPNNKYTLDTQVFQDDSRHYLGSDGYTDAPVAEWIIEQQTEGIYCISLDKTNYIGYDGNSTVVSMELTDPSDFNAQWQMVTKDQRIESLKDATNDNPLNATFLIAGAEVLRGDKRTDIWTDGPGKGGYNVLEGANFCLEKWNTTTFDVAQTLENIPNGYYKLDVQGFYRMGGTDANNADIAAENHKNGTEALNATLYANESETPLHSIMEGAQEETFIYGYSYSTYKGYVPQNMEAAASAFDKGLYAHTLWVNVTDGTLRLGIRKDAESKNDWTIFDNFRLTYYGEENPNGISDITTNDNLKVRSGIYDLSGRLISKDSTSLEGIRKGLYIIDGRKVLVR